ncbi:MAG: PD40 domain-containing protein [Bacteroidia bacterium]|nr:PD40 domain-containing protein [Bacteroidia bacterium]
MKKIFFVYAALCWFNITAQKNDSIKIVITNIGKEINSPYDEYAPIISADGSIMIFTSRRPFSEKEIKKEKEGKENVYSSAYKNNKWQTANSLSTSINQPNRFNSAIAISNDGQHLLLYRDDANANGDIWESFLKGTDWSAPVKMPEPVNSPKHESSASISPDGNTIYFVSEREGGLGGRDIWYCTKDKKSGGWQKAQNIGAEINTKGNEEGVFIHPDGKTLYFSSTGHGGIGQYDIFKSVFENGRWGKPLNLGEPITTPENDLFFVMAANGKIAYYSSSFHKDNAGKKDIYEITFIPQKKIKAKGPSLTLLKGTVTDSLTGKPLEARIEIADNQKNERVSEIKSNAATGNYLVSLPSGKNYNITVNADGYLFYSTNINITDTAAYKEIVRNIKLNKIEVGNKVILNNIFFDYDKASLRPESYIELSNLYNLMSANPKLRIEISGHTDNKGSASYNKNLSGSRAQSVVSYLISKGVEVDRLNFAGYGFQFPIATNDTDEGRQLNRRVEFKVLSK